MRYPNLFVLAFPLLSLVACSTHSTPSDDYGVEADSTLLDGGNDQNTDAPAVYDVGSADMLVKGDGNQVACTDFYTCLAKCTPANRDTCAPACLTTAVTVECETCMNGPLKACMLQHKCFTITGEPDLKCTQDHCKQQYETCLGTIDGSPFCIAGEQCTPLGIGESVCVIGGSTAHPWKPMTGAKPGERNGPCKKSPDCTKGLVCLISEPPWDNGLCVVPYCFIAPRK